jgi:hypothetical protein
MSMSMHAMTAIFSMDPTRKAQLIEGLEPSVIRTVRELPGFVTGFWSWDHAASVSYGFIVFDTEEHARALEAHLRENAEDLARQGTRLERAAVGEVIGAASGNRASAVDDAALWNRLGR